MTEQQQELYEKLLKKVNEFCLGQAAEDVIAAIDALVDDYETPKVDPASKPLENLKELEMWATNGYTACDVEKAISIIKTKRVDIAHLQDSKDCGEYNEVVKKLATLWRVLPLTEEEYQLVKEILK